MEEMTLRVPVAVKAKVTEDLKAKIVSDLETRLDMVNKFFLIWKQLSSKLNVFG